MQMESIDIHLLTGLDGHAACEHYQAAKKVMITISPASQPHNDCEHNSE